jgi:undecaprenyl-diphosphatase
MINLNSKLFFLFHNFSGKNKLLDYIMIFAAEGVFYLTIIFILVLGILEDLGREILLFSFVAIIISFISILVSHIFIKERRPFVRFGFTPLISFYKNLSFPSIHTTIMSVIFFSNLYFGSEWTPLILILLIWVAIARMYIGIHYPIDIIGGIFMGGISSVLTAILRNI